VEDINRQEVINLHSLLSSIKYMTNEQAIQILTNVTESISLSYKDHVTVKQALEALTVVEEVITPKK